MVVLGAQLLHIFPWLRYFRFRMPKFFARRVQGASEKLPNKTAPFFVGASTFFLPCGFTQALQLYALARGSAVTGALVMFVFSLGTLPALVSLGAFSSFIKDSLQRYFLKFSGAIVILVGIVTIQNGFALSGIRFDFIGQFIGKHQLLASTEQTVSGAMRDGTQVIDMTINGLDYFPSRFTVLQGVPVEWRIDGRSAQGCAQVVTIPSLGITEYIPKNTVKVIRFTARETGEIPFFCPMGMTSGDAAFLVVPNQERVIQKKYAVADETFLGKNGECNPEIMNCIPVQKLLMTVTKERGFYPNYFTVKKDIPVELEIDARAPLSGCMSTVVIPEYNVADTLLFGKKTTLRFTPTKEGRSLISCSMGTPMGEVRVIN
ncbi:MAG: sulfite exporter TauE/SafE family protein [Parcubacteria group bacterium]|nr:sulfite exporter TauE/SafE family protein [Parcubacteria group bacterium]